MRKSYYSFRDYTAESVLFMHRTLVAFIGILFLTGILIANLYDLQISHHIDYEIRSNENRIKLLPITTNRGLIYDRNGIQLASNCTVYQLEIMPEKVNNMQKTLDALRKIVNLNEDDIKHFKKEYAHSKHFTLIPIKDNLTEVQVARFAVNQYRFPGVEVKNYKRRYYPYGSVLTHVIGYVSKINNSDIERLDKEGKLANYTAMHEIGKLGIERYYEDFLRGQTGFEEVEVNNRGKIIHQLKKVFPQAGYDVYLTIDLKLQKFIEKLLKGNRGAVVVTNPKTGDILALVSMPSYDPNLFVNGISKKKYFELLNDKNRPLINRATQGIYPPASTVKPYVAVSALSSGIITRSTSLFDPGWWQLPGSEKRYHDWKKWGHGHLNIVKSLEESSDTFFYQIAYDMGIDRISKWMSKFGYGQYTGIDLAEERSGNMPTREWKLKRFKKPWYQGDTIPIGIGQGYWTATPIQMNKALMILINNGVIKVPHLFISAGEKNNNKAIWLHPHEKSIGDIHADCWKIAKDGMYGVANRINGTAHKYFANAPYKIAAKSGTAQIFSLKADEIYNEHKISKHLRDHKLMTAFAPYSDPKVAVSIILENSGASGTATVGVIMRQILDFVLLNGCNDPNISAHNIIMPRKNLVITTTIAVKGNDHR